MNRNLLTLILGDSLAILLVVLFGFAFHQTEAAARIQFTLLPFFAAWLLVAATLRLFSASTLQLAQLWRVPLALLIAAPLGGWLRSAWLATPMVPVFVLLLGLALAIALLAWRAVYIILTLKRVKA